MLPRGEISAPLPSSTYYPEPTLGQEYGGRSTGEGRKPESNHSVRDPAHRRRGRTRVPGIRRTTR